MELSSALSGLMAAKKKEQACRIHGVYQSILMPNGKWSECPECTLDESKAQQAQEVLESQKKLKEQAYRAKLEQLRIKAQIPKRFKNRALDGYVAESRQQKLALAVCQKYLANFSERFEAGGCITMLGKPGTGKTHLACGIGNALVAQGRSVLFVDVYEAMDMLKEQVFHFKKCSEREAIRAFSEVDLLILDEVGAQLGSDWEKLALFKIMQERYKECLPTIIISNLTHEEFKKYVGDRVDDRLQENKGVRLIFDWESYRSKT